MATSTATRKPHQRYRLADGAVVPSVTTVLRLIDKPAIPVWSNRLGLDGILYRAHLDSLADIGTCAHAMIAGDLTGRRPDVSDYTPGRLRVVRNVLDSFYSWMRDKALVTHQVETPLVSEAHGFGGCPDWLGLVNGVPTLIDWKTSPRVYDDHCYQVAAYSHLLTESGQDVAAARVVCLSRDDDEAFSERVIPAADLAPYFAVFLAALALHRAIAATKPRRRR